MKQEKSSVQPQQLQENFTCRHCRHCTCEEKGHEAGERHRWVTEAKALYGSEVQTYAFYFHHHR